MTKHSDKSQTQSGTISVFIAFLIGAIIAPLSIYYLQKSQFIPALLPTITVISKPTVQPATPTKEIPVWKAPTSNKQGYPIYSATDKNLKIFDLGTKTLKDAGALINCCGGELGLGNSDPLVSPDLRFTAYIDGDAHDLWVLSNETLVKTKISTGGNVTYITAWSPDSSKILYYSQKDSLASIKNAMAPWDTVEKFSPQSLSGFVLKDIKTSQTTALTPLDYVIGFVGNGTLLAKTGDASERLVTFDIGKFSADYSLITESFGFGSMQFSLSQDGKKWAFHYSANPTDDANIVFASFPQKMGVTVDSGTWAEVQWPVISKDGSKLLYQKADGVIEPGVPQNYVWYYDSSKDFEDYDDSADVAPITFNGLTDGKTGNPRMLGLGKP
ncbi:MAG: hypothetical protein CO141_01250, partial [Candidatus Moranbacteria bacterium CG_4_9_14_3_um_filter_42_9]